MKGGLVTGMGIVTTSALLILLSPSASARGLNDGASSTSVTATLEKGTVSGNKKPRPNPPDDGHHHDDDDDETPKPRETPAAAEPPVIPVVYLPGPEAPRVKLVRVKGDTVTKTVVQTVTGNEAILPAAGKPARLSLSGNESVPEKKTWEADPVLEKQREEPEEDESGLLFSALLIFLLAGGLCILIFVIRKTGKKEKDKNRSKNRF